jgi:isopropylmalate/homocitrate/citramalate synthase
MTGLISRCKRSVKTNQVKDGCICFTMTTSALHMEKKLRMTPTRVFEQTVCDSARNLMNDIEFSQKTAIGLIGFFCVAFLKQ